MFSFMKSNVDPVVPVIKQLPAKASTTYKIGQLATLSAGAVTLATGTTVPQYVVAENYVAPATEMKEISCYLIVPGQEYETTFAADASAVTEGSKVTIHTDSMQATATTTDGVLTILKHLGDGDVGAKAIVTF